MHEYHLLEILAGGFTLALIFGYIAQHLNLSPIVGYLLAGFLVGPQSPGFVADQGLALQLSEAGVILLMFGVGLHFNVDDLISVKGVSIPTIIGKGLIVGSLGAWLAFLFGFTFSEGFILGAGLSVASTVVALRVLSEGHMTNTIHEHVTVGCLVVEDVLTVLLLVLIPSMSGVLLGTEPFEIVEFSINIGIAFLKLGALWIMVMVVGGKFVPWLLVHIVRTRSQELFTLTILVVAFVTAVSASYFFNASFALGAFLGGMVVGKSNVSHQAGADLLPLRDAFAVLFFLSVGMLFQPAFLFEKPLMIFLALLLVILIKPLITALLVAFGGYSVRTALVTAIGLGQVGEFSFILAQTAHEYKLISQEIDDILVICAMVSIALNPLLFKYIPAIEKYLRQHKSLYRILTYQAERRALAKRPTTSTVDVKELEEPISAVVVGYGPSGQKVTKTLIKKGIVPVIIEMNVDTVEDLDLKGKYTVYGDSTKKDILLAAGIQYAQYLVITLPTISATAVTATIAKEINPDLRIFARARFLSDGELLEQIGIDVVAFEEEEVGVTLAKRLLADVLASAFEVSSTKPDNVTLEKE